MNSTIAQLSTNLATNEKWVVMIPINMIFDELSQNNISLNIYSFDIPPIEIEKAEWSYQGSSVEIPAPNKSFDKTITFEYILSNNWHQWNLIYDWMNKIVKEEGAGFDFDKLAEVMVPIRLFVLSPFKKPLFELIFHNAWCSGMGGIACDYQDNAPTIKTSFTLTYSHIEKVQINYET